LELCCAFSIPYAAPRTINRFLNELSSWGIGTVNSFLWVLSFGLPLLSKSIDVPDGALSPNSFS
jgi:hypothetical protein